MKSIKLKDGTPDSGFVTAKENHPPRECGNCRWYSDSCVHPKVMADPEVPKNEDGTGKVDADDCCDYFQNKPQDKLVSIKRLLSDLTKSVEELSSEDFEG